MWKALIGMILLIVAFIAICFGIWYFQRKIHYSFAYESQVKQTIREMVKPEALK